MGERSDSKPTMPRVGVVPFVLTLAAPAWALAADLTAPPAFEVGADRVEVDFVVRDREGALLRDLRPDEVAVFEDGVRQEIASFELIDRRARGPAGPDRDGEEPPVFLAVVFDRLSPSARHFARQALLDHLGSGASRAAVGVFTLDRGVSTLLPFTEDHATVARVLAGGGEGATTSWSGLADRELVRKAWHGLGEGFGQAYVAAAESEGPAECRVNENVLIRLPELMESRVVEAVGSLERDQQGQGTANALLALVNGLGTLPGRKALLLLSEGLAMPPGAEPVFQAVIAAAHRARVSVYAADAGGLRVASASDEMRRTLDNLSTRRHSTGEGGLMQEGFLTLLEKNEDALRLAPESGLTLLADGTGGFMVGGTNELGEGLKAVEEEMGAYYLLSYTPQKPEADGRFHRLSVHVERPHGRLQARKGYLAARTPLPVPVLPQEARALALLEQAPLPNAVPVRLRGLQFPDDPPGTRVPILVEVEGGDLSLEEDRDAGRFEQDFTIMVLIRDADGRVVDKLSQRYLLQGPLNQVAASREGTVLFYREARLPPGHYALQAVVHDALSDRAGAATADLDVRPTVPGRLRASSLMVVRRAEKLADEEQTASRPLQYDDVVLYPNLGQPISKGPGRELAFFVTAWPAAERLRVDARVQVRREGRTIAAAPPLRLEPQRDGPIRLVSSLPLDGFAPGDYELRVTLSDGLDAETRSTSVPLD